MFEEVNMYTEGAYRPFVEKTFDPGCQFMKDLLLGAISRPPMAVGKTEVAEVFSDPSRL